MMGEQIVLHGGTLEHFAGDGMMVFFNDPMLQEDHVERSVRMAVAMRRRFSELADAWARRGHELGFGIGIATGYRDARTHRIRGPVRLRHGRDCGHHRFAPELRRRSRADPARPKVVTRRWRIVDAQPVGELTLKGFSRPISPMNV